MQRFLALQLQGSEHVARDALDAAAASSSRAERRRRRRSHGALAVLRDTDLRGEIAGIAQPALVVSGERDTLAFPGAGRCLADHLPNARFALIPGAAHVPFLSHADAFGAALDGFLDAR